LQLSVCMTSHQKGNLITCFMFSIFDLQYTV
jgi:hypothetical protein